MYEFLWQSLIVFSAVKINHMMELQFVHLFLNLTWAQTVSTIQLRKNWRKYFLNNFLDI
jgi:hypothetical protein